MGHHAVLLSLGEVKTLHSFFFKSSDTFDMRASSNHYDITMTMECLCGTADPIRRTISTPVENLICVLTDFFHTFMSVQFKKAPRLFEPIVSSKGLSWRSKGPEKCRHVSEMYKDCKYVSCASVFYEFWGSMCQNSLVVAFLFSPTPPPWVSHEAVAD